MMYNTMEQTKYKWKGREKEYNQEYMKKYNKKVWKEIKSDPERYEKYKKAIKGYMRDHSKKNKSKDRE